MRSIQSGIRQKRFKVSADQPVQVTIEGAGGERHEGRLIDASLLGFAAAFPVDAIFHDAVVYPESRLSWGKTSSAPLGRLVVKRVSKKDESVEVAFACLDTRVPLFGSLSSCFEGLKHGDESPTEYELGSEKFNLASFQEGEFAHPDIFEKCRQYQLLLRDLKKNPLYQYYSIKLSSVGARSKYKLTGTNRKIDAVSFASYDYMGFSHHPEVKEGAIKAIEKFGVSASGTPILAGKTEIHEELEYKIARLYEKEDAILYTTGYATNIGVVSGLVKSQDLIVADIFAHASLYDGIGATRGRARFFKHNSVEHLQTILKEQRDEHYGTLVITEGLFSMEGTIPDLKKLTKVAHDHNARVYIDECHAVGVLGPRGLGASDKFGVLDEIDLYMGSFSKGLGGGGGGFVVGSKDVIEWLRFFSRQVMFSASLAPSIAGAGVKIVELIEREPERRAKLAKNIKRFRDGLERIGMQTPAHPESPIIPVVIGDQRVMGEMNKILLEHGIYVNCILYPAVPQDQCRFRFSVTVNHTDSEIDLAIMALQNASSKMLGDEESKNEKSTKKSA